MAYPTSRTCFLTPLREWRLKELRCRRRVGCCREWYAGAGGGGQAGCSLAGHSVAGVAIGHGPDCKPLCCPRSEQKVSDMDVFEVLYSLLFTNLMHTGRQKYCTVIYRAGKNMVLHLILLASLRYFSYIFICFYLFVFFICILFFLFASAEGQVANMRVFPAYLFSLFLRLCICFLKRILFALCFFILAHLCGFPFVSPFRGASR